MCLTLPRDADLRGGHREGAADLARPGACSSQLLPRSSTGERMNPYTSIWTGVTPGDGPQEFHLVLLDNGRTAALADQTGRQALRCIRCSACLNVCPVYERTGGHAYGSVYPGPIGAISRPLLRGVGHDERSTRCRTLRRCAAPATRCARSDRHPVGAGRPARAGGRRQARKDIFPRTNHLPAVRPGAPFAPATRRGAARRGDGRQAGGQVRPDQAAAAAAERLDRNPRRPRPAAGIVPRLVGQDQGTGR